MPPFRLLLVCALHLCFLHIDTAFLFSRVHKYVPDVRASLDDKEDLKGSFSKTNYEEYDGAQYGDQWQGSMEGFDWQLEQARRMLEGPGFAPLRMTLWQPPTVSTRPPPGLADSARILLNNALQILGFAESIDGAPLVLGLNNYNGSTMQLLSRVADGNLAELAGGPLFLLLREYYKQYGSIYKLAFGPKSFMVVSDPVMVKHILKDNALNYDKGILAEILEPVMGKVEIRFAASHYTLAFLIFLYNRRL